MKITKKIDGLALRLKSRILSAESRAEYFGRAYYLSENGNDANDGLTVNSPWKTLGKLNDVKFCEGDAILLERGSLFRGGIELTERGMVLSSYGVGEKPKIYGSKRNYNNISDWIKTDIPDVYCCSEVFEADVGNIVFDDGKGYALKQLVGNFGFDGTLGKLNVDLMIYHCNADNKLYICSKGGNPAERFQSIEICTKEYRVLLGADGITVDNICFKYFGGHAVCGTERKNILVENCEFGWIGGSVQFFNEQTKTYVRYGNAIEIYADVSDFTACYNYIYQVYDAGITHQIFHDVGRGLKMVNCNYHHNLIEYCSYSIEYTLQKQTTDEDYGMKNINISDNIMRFSGYGFGNQRPDYNNPAHIKSWDLENRSENFKIENNIFDRARCNLVHIASLKKEWFPKCKGNTYIQYQGGNFVRCGLSPARIYRYSEAKEFLKSEEKSACYIIEQKN